jgi:hypothetical protein
LNEQEKLEQIQRELEHERILSHLRTLETVLMNQQRTEQYGNQEFLRYKIQKQIRDLENNVECGDKYEKIALDCEKRVVMRLKLTQILGEIMQQIKNLKLKEQLHMTTAGQKLRHLMQQFECKQMIESTQLKDLVLRLVSGQVLSQVGLRRFYSELSNLLDEVEYNLRDLETCQEFECKPETIRMQIKKQFECNKPELEQEIYFTQGKQTTTIPTEYKCFPEQTPIEKFARIESELYTPSTFNTTGVPCMIKTTTVEGAYPQTQMEQLRRKFQELKSAKCGLEMRFNKNFENTKIEQFENKFGQQFENKFGQQFENKFGQQYSTENQTPCNFEQVLTQLKEIKLATPAGLVACKTSGTGSFGGLTQQQQQQGEEYLPEQTIFMTTKVMTKKERQDKTIFGSYPLNRFNF